MQPKKIECGGRCQGKTVTNSRANDEKCSKLVQESDLTKLKRVDNPEQISLAEATITTSH